MPNQSTSRWSHSTKATQSTRKTDRRESSDSSNTHKKSPSVDSATYDGVEATAVAVPTDLLPSLMSSAQAVNAKRRENSQSPTRRTQAPLQGGEIAQEVHMTKGKAKSVTVPKKKGGKKTAKKEVE